MRCVKTKHQNELAVAAAAGGSRELGAVGRERSTRYAQSSKLKGKQAEGLWQLEGARVFFETSKSSTSPWSANKRIKREHKSLKTGRRLPPVGEECGEG